MRAVTFAKGLKALRGDQVFALQKKPDVRLFRFAAISAAQSRALAKAALFRLDIDDYARAALLRVYEKEPRLLATIDQIAQKMQKRISPPAFAPRI